MAARLLQPRWLIEYSRGQIAVRDRAGLMAANCECPAKLRGRSEIADRSVTEMS